VVSPADSSVKALTIPDSNFGADSSLYFVELELKDRSGEAVSHNFYWIPAKATQFDWEKTDYTHTPAISHEDLTALRQLPKAQVEATLRLDKNGEWVVLLRNRSKVLAFKVAVDAQEGSGKDITPMPWSDNYLELSPGESRTITARPPKAGMEPRVVISGWNIPSRTLTAPARANATAGATTPAL
jgi:exo-1,4-beta-D-glucosaminidase